MKHTSRLLVILLIAYSCGCTRQATAPAADLTAKGAVELLQQNVDKLLSNPQFSRTQVSVEIFSLDRTECLYEKNAQRLFIPASCNKLITAGVALVRLGPEYRFETQLLTDGQVEDGTLKGNLLVTGDGDPTNSASFHEKDVFAVFRNCAAQLKAINIKKISGDLLGNDGAFGGAKFGSGWEWNDLPQSYAAPISALQFNDNALTLEIRPGTEKGSPALIRASPLADYFKIHNEIATGPEDTAPDIRIEFSDSDEAINISGTIARKSEAITKNVAVRNPALYYLSALKRTLSEEGIDLESCSIKSAGARTSPAFHRIWSFVSPNLSEILKPLLKESLNLHAETLVRTLGLSLRGEGTFARGKEIVEETLSQMGIENGTYSFADGSGLSRQNLQSADNLVRLLQSMYRDRNFQHFYEALPVAGIDGTLTARMKGTKAENNVRAKTGSMTGISSIAGYLKTADGEMLAFSIAVNNFIGSREPVDRLQDRIIELLAAFSRK